MPCRPTRGFTLVELMITVAVMAILVAIGFPGFQSVLASNRVATGTNELIASLALARGEAVRNTVSSGVCPSATGTDCGNDWSEGWLVWQDVDGNGNLDDAEPVLRYSQGRLGLELSSRGVTKFIFDSRGRATGRDVSDTVAAGAQVIAVRATGCSAEQSLARALTVMPTGQVRVVRQTCS
ncbi:MAG: GspH/FimT family pseudopilin [Pseudomonas sp.]